MRPFISVEGNWCILFNILPVGKEKTAEVLMHLPPPLSGIERSVQVMLAETVQKLEKLKMHSKKNNSSVLQIL